MSTAFTPTPQQSAAADPKNSVWVTANAGSGKTHVLVERVIRLLLEGAEPSTILCITFTKAAAAEMSSRLFDRLSKWTSLTDAQLVFELERIGLSDPNANRLLRARRLFTLVLETPGGLKIQTIHAFCERLLQLFPVEAGMAPGFRVLDERQSLNLREKAQDEILAVARSGRDPDLASAFAVVVANAVSDDFDSLVKMFIGASQDIKQLMESNLDAEAISLLLKSSFGLELSESSLSLAQKIRQINEQEYQRHADVLSPSMPYSGHETAKLMKEAVAADPRDDSLKKIFFKKDKALNPRKKLMSVSTAQSFPETFKFLESEQARLLHLFQQHDMLQRIEATQALFILAVAINKNLQAKKSQIGSYDFDDLIERTKSLLHNSRAAQWVLYKLDSGLNHILLDEAQDTSPAQWSIIQALAEEFFAGSGRPLNLERTIFVVGDRKQSIYSFQGADAASFAIARDSFTESIKSKGKTPAEIQLNISYRSTQTVLDAVNMVFPAINPQRFGFSPQDDLEQDHTTNRIGEKGRVEVWPLVLSIEEEEPDYWLAPIDREPAQSPKRRLAAQIAQTLKGWIGSRNLESTGQPVQPGDIMILMQSRGSLFSMLIAELRKIGVAVAGADRLKLLESIIVQDLLMLAQWILLPQDDHALACVLKSPFVPEPLTEVQLFELSYNRGTTSLWSRLSDQKNENALWLALLVKTANTLKPYDFFSKVLLRFRKTMLGRLGPEAGDASDAFLDQVLSHEIEFSPSLAGFLHWFNASETEVRRELEKATGEVRLMTVHGAKGLEAPIVFLPDAASVPKGRSANRLLMIYDKKTDLRLPLWMLSGLSVSEELQSRKDEAQLKEIAERNRLLYVAMTRARDELYICGAKGKRNDVPKDSWYAIVEPILGVTQQPIIDQRVEPTFSPQSKPKAALPPWLFKMAPIDPVENWRSVTQNTATKSGVEELQRGISVHSLLQLLPTIDPNDRVSFAIAQAKRLKLDEQTALSIVNLVNAPELQIFFGPDSEAEVEISGTLSNGRYLTGRIDRIVRSPSEITLLDFKSDRSVPSALDPAHSYVQQIALYARLLKMALPDHNIKAALLWTQTSKLEWISTEVLEQASDLALNNL